MSIDKFGRASLPGLQHHQVSSLIKSQGLPRTSDGNYNVGNLRLCNVGAPLSKKDAVTKQYVDELVDGLKRHVLSTERELVRIASATIPTLQEAVTGFVSETSQALEDIKLHLRSRVE